VDLVSRDARQLIESHLDGLIDRVLGGCPEPDTGRTGRGPLVETIRRFVLAGGKRVRPQLCLWAYGQVRGDEPVPTGALDVACAWELFHAFLLAHDDIIDGADRRRGAPTLHHRLASLDSGSLVFGANLGIVAGDLLCVGSLRLLHELDVPELGLTAAGYQRLLRLFSRVACETGFGQAIDIVQSHVPIGQVDEAVVLQGYLWKTAAYTFEGPMLSGALLAGLSDPAALAAVSKFALAIGQAYQLHNDLLDLQAESHDGSDLVQGKRTPTLLRARLAMDPDRRRSFDERLTRVARAGPVAVELAEELRQELVADGAIERTQTIIEELLDEARSAAEDPALPPRLAAAQGGLLAGLAAKYFSAVLV
jgi:geranylgeranyl diphosphate synthase type I